jgi:hypothetical protein
MTFGREDVRARRDALALDAIAIGAGHGETRAFASIAAMREARGQSHTRVSSLRLWSPEHPWRGAWDARPWTETHVWSRRADCAASRASASARLAAASARTHGFAAALPTPTIAGERREVHGNRLSLWHAPGWTSAWDSRRWRQTISVPSHITHTKE